MKGFGIGNRRILVVEDEPVICGICMTVLGREGFRVDIAANGKLAEDRIKQEVYDLILVDIKTPVMNGKELYRSIIEKYPQLAGRLIFTTGDVMAKDIESFVLSSGRPFLPKPYTPEELSQIVKKTLDKLEGNSGKE